MRTRLELLACLLLLPRFATAQREPWSWECDILITPHPGASSPLERVDAKTLVDPRACRRYVARAREALASRLKREGAPRQ